MKIKYLLVILLSPLFLFAQPSPKFEVVGGESIDLGDHMRGREVRQEIEFKNTGTDDLKVISVSTTCGCSSALISSDVIKPGETGKISFTYNGLSTGKVTKGVVVTTNEPMNNVHNLAVTVNMVEPLMLNPSSIMAVGKVGEELSQIATLQNTMDKEVSITEVVSNSPAVKVLSDKVMLAKGEAASIQIAIKIFEDAPVNAAVEIKTSEGDFQIPIFVEVKND